ncbi:hypothetical protein PUN28_011405 [Cardiocondyla obscurior]|uniref:Uncharacterized protein n=1 Tax=Cardiocondyla obscurior TaxID=286306 RepID=A0AAW2FFP6_9HYME
MKHNVWIIKDAAVAANDDDDDDDENVDNDNDDVRGNTVYITDQYRNNLPILTRYFRDASPGSPYQYAKSRTNIDWKILCRHSWLDDFIDR